MLDGMKLSADI